MNKVLFLSLAIASAGLCSCARQYTIKLSNGNEINTAGKPSLVEGSYHYKDARGVDNTVPAGRVTEIEPASMSKEEQKPLPSPTRARHRHWYLLWLA